MCGAMCVCVGLGVGGALGVHMCMCELCAFCICVSVGIFYIVPHVCIVCTVRICACVHKVSRVFWTVTGR